ncbi:nucleotidyltransferase domain-containing protein [Ascidiaceihabitans sp.]|uniref:nucleotidyltransferase domain-containing protein n=1 Tax=Ascidiaceihabitans sp. TaxID=1872644 RepID=UPI0032979F88
MNHQSVIETITTSLKDEPEISGLFLGGSYGNGLADAYSDIDFILVSDTGATDEIAQLWHKAIAQTGEIVLWWDRTTVPVLINAITADWTRSDVLILKPEQLGGYAQNTLKPLFDHTGLFDTLKESVPSVAPNPKRLKYQYEEFIRVLGLLHLASGREEYINGVLGVFHLRNILVELLITQTNAPHRGGMLHLNRLLSASQKALLTGLPAPSVSRAGMIEAHLAYAAAYLPRAREQAKASGVEWPERFEAVTWDRLEKTLGIKRPYDPDDAQA